MRLTYSNSNNDELRVAVLLWPSGDCSRRVAHSWAHAARAGASSDRPGQAPGSPEHTQRACPSPAAVMSLALNPGGRCLVLGAAATCTPATLRDVYGFKQRAAWQSPQVRAQRPVTPVKHLFLNRSSCGGRADKENHPIAYRGSKESASRRWVPCFAGLHLTATGGGQS